MLNRFPGYGDVLDFIDEKFLETYDKYGLEKAIEQNKARAGLLRNYDNLNISEIGRRIGLEKARQLGDQRRNEKEMLAYDQATADRLAEAKRRQAAMIARNQRLNQDVTYNPGVGVPQSITNIREVGPAGYQPGYQGGVDFADLQGTTPPGPTNRPPYEGGMDFANLLGMSPPPPTASSVVDAALDAGQQIARDQNRSANQGFFSNAREDVSSLFGDIGSGLGDALRSPLVQRLLSIMARPEFQDPEGISAGIAGAAYGLKQDEIKAAEKEMQRQRLENEAKRQAFFDKLRIEEAGRAQRREERAIQKAGETKYRTLTEKQETKLVSRAKQIKEVADFVDASSATLYGRKVLGKDLPSSVDLYTDLVRTATEKMDEEKIPFDRAIRMVVQERQQPSTKSNVPQAQQSVDPAGNVKIRKPT